MLQLSQDSRLLRCIQLEFSFPDFNVGKYENFADIRHSTRISFEKYVIFKALSVSEIASCLYILQAWHAKSNYTELLKVQSSEEFF